MSTSKTENYQLHAWELEDDFLLSEINENFTLLDMAARVVTGTYTGDGVASQVISLGFTPKAVLVMNGQGEMNTGYHTYGGLALPGLPSTQWLGGPVKSSVEIREGGFAVFYYSSGGSYSVNANESKTVFYYLAIR